MTEQGSENEYAQLSNLFTQVIDLCLPEHEQDDETGSLLPMLAAFHDKQKNQLVYFSTLDKRMISYCSEQMLLVWECLNKDESEVDEQVMDDWTEALCVAKKVLPQSRDFEDRMTLLQKVAEELDEAFSVLDCAWFLCYEYQQLGEGSVTRKVFPTMCTTTTEEYPVIHIAWSMLQVSEFSFHSAKFAFQETQADSATSNYLLEYIETLEQENQTT